MEVGEQRPAADDDFEIVDEEAEESAKGSGNGAGNGRGTGNGAGSGSGSGSSSSNGSSSNSSSSSNGSSNSSAPPVQPTARPRTVRPRTAAQQEKLAAEKAMYETLKEEYRKFFEGRTDTPKVPGSQPPKPNFLQAVKLLKIKTEQGEEAYQQALFDLMNRNQNIYYGYSNQYQSPKAPNAAAANRVNSAPVSPQPVAAAPAAASPAAASPALFRSSQTRRRIIRSLEEVLEALRVEDGALPSARSPRPATPKRAGVKSKRKTLRMAAPAPRSPGAGPAQGPPTGQQAIARARATLTRKAGVKISQKIAAPFAKWARGKPREEVSAKKAEVAAALQARAGRNNNAIAVNTGLKTRDNVERRRQELQAMKAKKAAAAAGQ